MKQCIIDKYADNTITIRTFFPLNKETVTIFNVMIVMMKMKTKRFGSKAEISNALNDAYAMKASYGLTAYGQSLALDVRFQYIRNDWIHEEGYLDQVLKIMDEFLFHAKFLEEDLPEAKYMHESKLLSMLDDPDELAMINAQKEVQSDSLPIMVSGYLEDVHKIVLDDIKACYEQYLENERFVYTCGDIEPKVSDYLASFASTKRPEIISKMVENQSPKYSIVKKDINTTSIVRLYATSCAFNDEEYPALVVMNSMLGQSPGNILFDTIREKESLCYSIGSGLMRFDGILYIFAQTRKHHLSKMQTMIDQAFGLLDNEELLEIAKKDVIDSIIVGQDRPLSVIESMYLDDVFNRKQSYEKRIQQVEKITLKDILRVSSRLLLVSESIVEEIADEEV